MGNEIPDSPKNKPSTQQFPTLSEPLKRFLQPHFQESPQLETLTEGGPKQCGNSELWKLFESGEQSRYVSLMAQAEALRRIKQISPQEYAAGLKARGIKRGYSPAAKANRIFLSSQRRKNNDK